MQLWSRVTAKDTCKPDMAPVIHFILEMNVCFEMYLSRHTKPDLVEHASALYALPSTSAFRDLSFAASRLT